MTHCLHSEHVPWSALGRGVEMRIVHADPETGRWWSSHSEFVHSEFVPTSMATRAWVASAGALLVAEELFSMHVCMHDRAVPAHDDHRVGHRVESGKSSASSIRWHLGSASCQVDGRPSVSKGWYFAPCAPLGAESRPL